MLNSKQLKRKLQLGSLTRKFVSFPKTWNLYRSFKMDNFLPVASFVLFHCPKDCNLGWSIQGGWGLTSPEDKKVMLNSIPPEKAPTTPRNNLIFLLTLIYRRGVVTTPLRFIFRPAKTLNFTIKWVQLIVGSSFLVTLAKKKNDYKLSKLGVGGWLPPCKICFCS